MRLPSYFAFVCGALVSIAAAGCSATTGEETAESSAEISTTLHEPTGAERTAILDGFRVQLAKDLNNQKVVFNKNNPDAPGRFFAHNDWAYFEGILEGPDGNTTPIDYLNSIYKQDFIDKFLGGVTVGGNFAAKFSALAKRNADGTWSIATVSWGENENPTYRVGALWETWQSWVSVPPPGSRDVFVSFPYDDLHAPEGAERTAILAAIGAQIKTDLNNQAAFFNSSDPPGVFLSHDGWAYFDGIIEGPNGNTTPINYQNSIYAEAAQTTAFKGILRNNHFAATLRVLLKKNADNTWSIAASKDGEFNYRGYEVGNNKWVGDPTSQWAWDIFGGKGEGEGEGDGDGDGEGG